MMSAMVALVTLLAMVGQGAVHADLNSGAELAEPGVPDSDDSALLSSVLAEDDSCADATGVQACAVKLLQLRAKQVAASAGLDICGDISARRVFDIQWSGDEASTTQRCSGFAKPYSPGVGRLSVDRAHDFFRLRKASSGSYFLYHFGKGGRLKNEMSGGKVKLGDDDALFYIIDGWYATLITKSEAYKDGDKATFEGLTRDPSLAECD